MLGMLGLRIGIIRRVMKHRSCPWMQGKEGVPDLLYCKGCGYSGDCVGERIMMFQGAKEGYENKTMYPPID